MGRVDAVISNANVSISDCHLSSLARLVSCHSRRIEIAPDAGTMFTMREAARLLTKRARLGFCACAIALQLQMNSRLIRQHSLSSAVEKRKLLCWKWITETLQTIFSKLMEISEVPFCSKVVTSITPASKSLLDWYLAWRMLLLLSCTVGNIFVTDAEVCCVSNCNFNASPSTEGF